MRDPDCVLKLARAREHLNELTALLNNWTHSGHHEVINEPDPVSGPDWFRVRVHTDPVPVVPFSLLIGDVLHNLRSALDHLAYALAEKHHAGRSLPDAIARESEFPIYRYDNPTAFTKKTRGIHPEAQKIIAELQPYQRGSECALDRLWMLHDLTTTDKHSLLLTGAVANVATGFSPHRSQNWQLHGVHVEKTFIVGEITVIRYRATPKTPTGPEMYVHFDPL